MRPNWWAQRRPDALPGGIQGIPEWIDATSAKEPARSMLSTAIRIFEYLTYPPHLSLWLIACGAFAWVVRRRIMGWGLIAFALTWSSLWSVPQFSEWLRAPLERQHIVLEESLLPKADAIVVLGGGNIKLDQLMGSRVAAAARAWFAGRAPVVIVSGGGGRYGSGRGRSEAERMARAILSLGVPESALVLENRSRNTEQNAQFTAQLARPRGIKHVLLVTSSVHMPRASLLFGQTGLAVTPVPVPEGSGLVDWSERWIPTRSALWRSGRGLKEYAGLLAVSFER